MKPSVITSILLMITAISGSGCSLICQNMNGWGLRHKAAPASAQFIEAQKLVQARRFSEAIAAYRLVIQEHPATEWAPEAKYHIALAHVSPENPQRDYALGLSELDEFLASYPQDPRSDEAKSWRTTLRTLLDTRKENDRLNKNIEKLKQLDVRQEEKRLGR